MTGVDVDGWAPGFLLCYLHEDADQEHWVPPDELVGVVNPDTGRMVPASVVCADANGVEADRVVDWDPTRAAVTR